MKKIKLIFSLLFISLVFVTCRKDDDHYLENVLDESFQAVNYTVTLPEGIPLDKLKDFTISNVNGDFPLQIDTVQKKTASGSGLLSSGISSIVKVYEYGSYQLHFLNDKYGNPVMVDILSINGALSKVNEFSVENTALAMIMTHPLLISSNEQNFENVRDKLKTLSEFNDYKSFVEQKIIESVQNQFTPDFTNTPFYKKTVIGLINTTTENYNVPVGMMDCKLHSRENGVLEYSLINEHKRILHFYPKKVYLDNLGLESDIMDFPMLDIDGFPELSAVPEFDILYPKGFSFTESILPGGDFWKVLSGEDISIFRTESHIIEKDLGDANQLQVDVYGLGQLDKPFNELSQEDKIKFSMVALHGAYTDFIVPMIDLFYGIKNVKSSGVSDQRFDFRYGSRKYPEQALLKAFSEQFVKDPNNIVQYSQYLLDKDFMGAGMFLLKFMSDEILEDLQDSTNKRRYLNHLYNIFKKQTGITKTSEGFRKNIKSMMNQTSAMKNANFAGKIIKVGELATNIGFAIQAYYTTPYKHSFKFNKTADQELSLITPVDNKNFLESNLINFDWSYDRGNSVLGSVYYNLIINEERGCPLNSVC